MKDNSIFIKVLLSGLVVLATAGNALGVGLMSEPSTAFSFDGSLAGMEGGSIPDDGFIFPVNLVNQPLPYSTWGSESLNSGYASSEYYISISSDFEESSDYVQMQLQLMVAGEVLGDWDNWSEWSSDLEGSLVSFVELQDWTSTRLTLDRSWGWFSEEELDIAGADFNTVTVRGPLIADWTNQEAFIFEYTVELPQNWADLTSDAQEDFFNLVPGTYVVEFHTRIHSGTKRNGSNTINQGFDINNNFDIWAQNSIDPDACLTGVPCPTAADIDGNDAVDSADFHLWYQTGVDVTSDGLINTADEAAMAYLLGLDMIDADGNGIVDGLAPSPVLPGAALTAAVELHPAYPNPFNPMTVLSFSLPSDQPVDLSIYDVKGNRVRTLLASETFGAGRHEVTWNGRNDKGLPTPAGVYFFRLGTKSDVQTGRMMLLK